MKLAKRIAVGILTALLAVSMLTACGGGGSSSGKPSTGGSTGSKPGTSSGTNNGSNNGTSTGTKPGTSKDDNTTVDPSKQTGRALKYFTRKGVTGKKRYIRYYDETKQWEYTEACDGERGYVYGYVFADSNDTSKKDPAIDLYDKTENNLYRILPKEKAIYLNDGICDLTRIQTVTGIPNNIEVLASADHGIKKFKGKEYYYEEYARNTYYFEKTDTEGTKLLYIDTGYRTLKIEEVSSTYDESLLQIPENYTLNYVDSDGYHQSTTGKDSYPN